MHIVLVRHTTTDWNERGRQQGQHDTKLNDKGEEEARALAELLRKLPISKIVCSDLKRASATADIIAEVLSKKVVLDERLRECSFGEIEGMTEAEAFAKYGDKLKENWTKNYKHYDFKPYGGESREEVLSRHLECLRDMDTGLQDWVCIVGHDRALCTLLDYLKLDPKLPLGSYKTIEFNGQTKNA
ncbi:MAG: histidine phosphatase family protein [Candidatus Taylorbacteria bacterium]|nr:histidine phosphatase family protein [Candidatus Taylorbacteria bacterium]